MGEWQPIETAPKDGTNILGVYVFNSSTGAAADYSIMCWRGEDWVATADGEIVSLGGSGILTDYINPYCTHWMPLPSPPPNTTTQKESA